MTTIIATLCKKNYYRLKLINTPRRHILRSPVCMFGVSALPRRNCTNKMDYYVKFKTIGLHVGR